MPQPALPYHLRSRGGLATVADLADAAGCSQRAVRRQADRQGWWCPFPDVVGLPRARPSARDHIHAAALQAAGRTGDPDRDLVAVTRLSALHLLGLGASAPTRVDLVVPAWRYVKPDPQLSVTRSSHLDAADITVRANIPYLKPAPLLRDLAAIRDVDRLRLDAIELLRRTAVTLDDVEAVLAHGSAFPGSGRLRRVVKELRSVGRVDSALEYRARQRFRAAGIEFDRGQVHVAAPIGGPSDWAMHLDLGIAAIRFGIEVDSFAHHSSPEALRRDAERANRLALLPEDWRVLHLTWWDLQDRWPAFVAMTRAVIEAQSVRHLGRPWPTSGDLVR